MINPKLCPSPDCRSHGGGRRGSLTSRWCQYEDPHCPQPLIQNLLLPPAHIWCSAHHTLPTALVEFCITFPTKFLMPSPPERSKAVVLCASSQWHRAPCYAGHLPGYRCMLGGDNPQALGWMLVRPGCGSSAVAAALTVLLLPPRCSNAPTLTSLCYFWLDGFPPPANIAATASPPPQSLWRIATSLPMQTYPSGRSLSQWPHPKGLFSTASRTSAPSSSTGHPGYGLRPSSCPIWAPPCHQSSVSSATLNSWLCVPLENLTLCLSSCQIWKQMSSDNIPLTPLTVSSGKLDANDCPLQRH